MFAVSILTFWFHQRSICFNVLFNAVYLVKWEKDGQFSDFSKNDRQTAGVFRNLGSGVGEFVRIAIKM